MSRLTTLYIDKEAHKFSAAHFTIFSATERERLHGHNYSVSARIVAEMGDNGFSADYNVYKQRIAALCEPLDEYMLLAGESPHQTIEVVGGSSGSPLTGVPSSSSQTKPKYCPWSMLPLKPWHTCYSMN